MRRELIALLAALTGMFMLLWNYPSSSSVYLIEFNYEHVVIESTQSPSPPALLKLDAEHTECFKVRIESLRPPYFPWTWTCPTTEEEVLVETKLYSYDNNGTALLDQPAWGQLCNRMGVLSGALLRAKTEGHALLALNPIWSELVWHLDLNAVSYAMRNSGGDGGGLLLDCVECANTNQVRCNNLLLPGGNLHSVKRMFFIIKARYETSLLYSRYRPRNRGFSPYIAENLIPKRLLINQVTAQMQQFAAAAGQTNLLFGIHRRTMDRQCVKYASSRTEYNCLVTEPLYKEADAIAKALTSKQFTTNEVEQAHPMFMACNYTLNTPAQVEEIVSRFTTTTEKINLLLSTDGMDPAGDLALAKSSIVNNTFKLDLQCFQQHNFQTMLAEMVALSMAAVHVENPLSSCGNLVAHWRVKLFPQANYTSFPNACYDYFYNQEVHPL